MSAIAEVQARALLARLQAELAGITGQLRADAAAECAAIGRQARHEARLRLRAAVAEKRRRVADRCRVVEIECETQRRQAAFADAARLTSEGLAALPAALSDRWRHAEARRTWCAAALAVAVRVLRARDWTVELGPGAGTEERRLIDAGAAADGAAVREYRSIGEAGLRIGSATTWVDATAPCLARDRDRLAAELLAQLMRPEPAP